MLHEGLWLKVFLSLRLVYAVKGSTNYKTIIRDQSLSQGSCGASGLHDAESFSPIPSTDENIWVSNLIKHRGIKTGCFDTAGHISRQAYVKVPATEVKKEKLAHSHGACP